MSLDTRNQIWGALPPLQFTADNELHLPGHDPHLTQQIVARLTAKDFDAWSTAASRVGFCSNPVHLVGSSTTFDKATRGGPVDLLLGR